MRRVENLQGKIDRSVVGYLSVRFVRTPPDGWTLSGILRGL